MGAAIIVTHKGFLEVQLGAWEADFLEVALIREKNKELLVGMGENS